ncbi:hypothetical protein [Xanthocytophaga agilis]|uniref:Lipoprotein n=1 Tax=Xanthocytophaga agilis TaxID=3048010 RepID=A0AAE3R4S5_9BACT|nr:hypothetical protein [Xanthocytophaga agilis]MDJ1501370.1 hypothetical protein [Xanthocytophaga agilis]
MFTYLTKALLIVAITIVSLTSCIVEKRTTVVQQSKPAKAKPMPPGQAKKAAGSQSAKSFAPGQQKKKH